MHNLKSALIFFEKKDKKIYNILSDKVIVNWFEKQTKSKRPEPFISLCEAIIGQQLSMKAADSIIKKFKELFQNKKPTPISVLEKDESILRQAGLSFSKIKYLKDLSYKVSSKEIDLKKLKDMSDEEVMMELISVKGIGPWTVEMFLIFDLKRDDVFSKGDLGIRKGIQRLYKIDEISDERMERLSLKWKPYRSYACIALWNAQKN